MIESLTLNFQENIEFGQKPNNFGEEEKQEEEKYPGIEQTDVFVEILQSCPFYRLRSFEIRGLHPHTLSRPYLYECGTSAMWRQFSLGLQEVRDQAVARIIEAAVIAATAEPNPLPNNSTIDTNVRSRGIRRLTISDSTSFRKLSLQMITDTSLSTTLEELDVQRCGYFRSEEMHFVLSRLPNLRVADFRCRDKMAVLSPYSGLLPKKLSYEEELKYGYTSPPSSPAGTEDDIPVIPPRIWACCGSLRSLRIGVTNASIERYTDGHYYRGFEMWIRGAEIYWIRDHPETRKPYPEALHWFFDQIATLTQLKELCLVTVEPEYHTTRSLEISLKAGLDRWSTLRDLECLDVEELDHSIGLEDVKWMVDNWPALRTIRGLIHETDMFLSEAVIWLRNARPDIELPVSTVVPRMNAVQAMNYYGDDDDL
ncbi:hypothetical protein BGZ80_006991 [Entomortierella chlamydospora]|uniref:Uncharacterized protein n=1 Tax=Entomortierella chlamydospora TaxID=101097 RepID=A0A9P6SSI8_9FUNG|nr:hypothetical protein BGZ79_001953 [Entomortierella chlamydospora]KAF9997521.1 hypothetical protein BGZ80_006991 [Entomortierella chlamydospora]